MSLFSPIDWGEAAKLAGNTLFPGAGTAVDGYYDASQAIAPVAAPTISNYISGSGGYTAPTGPTAQELETQRQTAATIGQYDNLIGQWNNELGRLGSVEEGGINNINNQTTLARNRLGEDRNVARRNYELTDQGNVQNFLQGRGAVRSRMNSQNNALMRLLGANGAGSSSAMQDQVPSAVAQYGTQLLNPMQQAYNQNDQSIEYNWNDTQNRFGRADEDINMQADKLTRGLKSQISQTRAGLLDKIANATANKTLASGGNWQQAQAAMSPLQQQVNSLLDQIVGLGKDPAINAQSVAYQAPTLADYQMGNAAGIRQQSGPAAGVNPQFLNILGGRDDEYRNLLG